MAKTIKNVYYSWILNLISDDMTNVNDYKKLLNCLFNTTFTYALPLDSNRAADGIQLRYRFAVDNECSMNVMKKYIDNRECSILEMMVGLSLRANEELLVTATDEYTGKLFWEMIENMGLIPMNDYNYNQNNVNIIIERFLNRKYKFNGEGSMFIVDNGKDLRTTEIWYQMCWYINQIYLYN